MTNGKFVLLYSQESTRLRKPNRAITNDGNEVEYTCMVEESEFGPWQQNYHWKDAKVVGYMDRHKQITHCSEIVDPPEVRRLQSELSAANSKIVELEASIQAEVVTRHCAIPQPT